MPTPDIRSYLRRGRLVLLSLLCVAGSQLAVAGHQFQHDELVVSDSCAACVQLEQLDGPLSDLDAAPPLPSACAGVFQVVDVTPAAAPFTHYLGRAPPRF